MKRNRNADGTYAKEDYSEEIGKKYGMLTILEINRRKGTDREVVTCKCICKCGNTIELDLKSLKNKRIKNCGCIEKEEKYQELIGKRFGKLTVIEKMPYTLIDESKYKCLCDCGNIVEISRHNLLYNSNTRSCGCIRKISRYNDNISKANRSGVKGVYYEESVNKWVAKLTVNCKTYKKRFEKFEDAVKYRKEMEEIYHKTLKDEYYKHKENIKKENRGIAKKKSVDNSYIL